MPNRASPPSANRRVNKRAKERLGEFLNAVRDGSADYENDEANQGFAQQLKASGQAFFVTRPRNVCYARRYLVGLARCGAIARYKHGRRLVLLSVCERGPTAR
jgi:hypothetical protein